GLAEIVDYLSASPGRFLRLTGKDGEERYVALTSELRRRLDEILGLGTHAGRGLRFPSLAAPLVAELLASSQIEADASWRRQVERLTASGTEPVVPSTLRGELRPYQIDGFRWLVRLGTWGAGGCLADEMGLGKTLQCIALLLHRAPSGPGLVVAPTSVVPNWVDEVQRFAPTLRVRTFIGPARAADLADLGAFDLVVTSYAILQIDADALAAISFATAVLDEAQVIKNADTKRARAAGRLRAELRVATTGTPIENRLEDLHGIFAFLNPGLLGSSESFQARFVRAIDRPNVRDRLRRLVAPFILRRTKTQVLPELPSRTEVTLRIPLELEELALYEVVRKEALAQLGSGGGPMRMKLLAAITRLRQAASNARLLLPDSTAPSAKLDALGELLDDLLPSRHKVLIFSQFVGHLALVKELLHARGVSFQYLDGSTPMAARKIAVDSFQAGRGEVFLISLKAGGFGLNLTAADYVVHMDPWWNPAVEDQASDRAHRIGQTRPVTIYRLVARDTIEDRILALHHHKRQLAAGILEGSELAGSISERELLDLIRGP
nr:DEAD/DEAH box helicase [Deltaproteobacteria bacterium]